MQAQFRRAIIIGSTLLALASLSHAALVGWASLAGQEQGPSRREFHVSAGSYRFEPARLEVRQDDLVKVTFHAVDMPHSFTIDSYRIAKRAGAGRTVTFEFRADQAGRFPFYCNLALDERCSQMRGELVVHPH